MGLLAGEKRKQKIGLDPNNLTWAKDTSSVGQSMLKKMGWKEGAGLGANEDGRVIPVKASMKCNTTGLGCTAQQADAWIAHGEEFDQILASLNASTDNGNGSPASGRSSPKEGMDGQRRFYGRFSRGGVKKTRTAEDLNCIFGRRTTSTPSVNVSKEEVRSEESSDSSEDDDDSQDKNVDKSHGVETVTSSYSVQEYFAQKLKKLKQKKEGGEDVTTTLETGGQNDDDEKLNTETEEPEFNKYMTSTLSVKDYFAQKMRMKNEKLKEVDCKCSEDKESDGEKENSLSTDCVNADEDGSEVGCLGEKQTDSKMKKKLKKKKREAEEIEITENSSMLNQSENTDDKSEKKKKKKKRKVEDDVEVCNDEHVSNGAKTEKRVKKKKTVDVEICHKDACEDEKAEKKKRKKKRKAEEEADVCDVDVETVKNGDISCDEEITKKKKKKKKRRKTDNDD